MKKLLFLLIAVASVFTSCSKDDEPNGGNETKPLTKSDIHGVWEDSQGNFLSFNENGFFCFLYLSTDNVGLESGSYTLTQSTVTGYNPYFDTNMVVEIKKVENNKLSANIKYFSKHKTEKNVEVYMTKTSSVPADKENPLIGRSETVNVYGQSGSFLWKKTTEFSSFNSGKMTANQGNAEKYPLSFYYVYINGNLYYQIYNNYQIPSIGGWSNYNNSGDIIFAPVTIKNGSISIGSTTILTKDL